MGGRSLMTFNPNNVAQACGDVLLAADALDDASLRLWLASTSKWSQSPLGPVNREMAHSLCRLLAAVRDKRSHDERLWRQELRHRGERVEIPH